ncbi:MAG TPA: MaoC family dehydratase N-terminal domain-containing protein [Bryobacteraceae bacterium]|nr:MaoC family dehydratase N-terminal domain-containing protein [Bryobacteraceae bacterium]
MNIAHLREWIGRSEIVADVVTAAPIAALAATLDLDSPRAGSPLQPLWHWLYFLPIHRHSQLGRDGHAHRGGFLPPVDLPRRMWAGGRLEFHAPLRAGDVITRTSRIEDVRFKQGRSGPLVFVLVRHEIANAAGLTITEEHDIVYRDHSRPEDPLPPSQFAPTDPSWERRIHPDDVLLFRYSALTFNAHRIHYDRRYATEVEGYPGLVVHGPLLATLLMDLLHRNLPASTVTRFEFRAVGPVFDTVDFSVCGNLSDRGDSVLLWVKDSTGVLAMNAVANTARNAADVNS